MKYSMIRCAMTNEEKGLFNVPWTSGRSSATLPVIFSAGPMARPF